MRFNLSLMFGAVFVVLAWLFGVLVSLAIPTAVVLVCGRYMGWW